MSARLTAWLYQPAPLARIAALRFLVYAFVPVDVLVTTPWIAAHGDLPAAAYKPLLVGRLLHLPVPTPLLVELVRVALLIAAVVAMSGRAPRLSGGAVFALYFQWMIIGMSYGKVDHDRFAYLVALAVLPTVGPAAIQSRRCSEAAGWAVRCIEIAVVATYFLAVVAKLRYGGWGWPNSGILTWALLRRGNDWALPLLDYPTVLLVAQWGTVLMELAAPALLLLTGRSRYLFVAGLVGFHLATFAFVSIIFLPHLVAMTAFVPLERLSRALSSDGGARRRGGRGSRDAPSNLATRE